MTKRLLLLAAVVAVFGVLSAARSGVTGYVPPTEQWLEKQVPKNLAGYEMVPGKENPEQTYRMPDATYKQLNPFGIVARHYVKDGKMFDAVVIAGDNADCFHDQRACFTAQGWELKTDKTILLDTKKLGKTPAVLLDVESEQHRALSVFAFRGPSGRTFSDSQPMWADFMKAELATGRIQQGQFFRVIAMTPDITEQELLEFSAALIDGTVEKLEGESQ